MADLDSVLFVFCKWDLDKCGSISEHVLLKVLTELAEMSVEAVHVLFEHVDADANGSINYEEFSNWLYSSTSPSDSILMQECRCPDGHEFNTFAPEVDGWCCEECGDDLEIHREALQCSQCAGLCWCIKCTIGQADVDTAEAIALSAAKATADFHMLHAGKDNEAEEEDCADQMDEQALCEEQEPEYHAPTLEPTEGPVLLNVCSLSEPLCAVEADRQWTVFQVKGAIEVATGIPDLAQSLIFGFLALQDDDMLGALNVPNGAQIVLLRRSELQTEWLKKIRTADRVPDVPDDRRPAFLPARSVPSFLANAPEEICADRLVVLEAVSRCGSDFRFASCDLRGDRAIALAAAKMDTFALSYATPTLLASRDFGFEAVQMEGMCLQYLSDHLRADAEVVTAAVRNRGLALIHAAEELFLDRDLANLAVDCGFTLRHNLSRRLGDHQAIVLAAVQLHEKEVRFASHRLRSDRWFAMELLKQSPWHLRNIATELTSDPDVLATALFNGFTLRDAPEKLRANHDVVYFTVQKKGLELAHASQELRANRKIVTAAVRQNGMALQYASFQLRNERKIVEVAYKSDSSAVKYAGAHLRNAFH